MGYLNKAPDEEVDPIYPTSGAIQIQDKSNLEICEELVSQKRDQMQQIQNQQILENKAQIAKEKNEAQKAREIANINKELQNQDFTYDFNGNLIIQNQNVGGQVPPDFQFRYKLKRNFLSFINVTSKKSSKKVIIPFEETKQTGSKISDYNKLTKLCGQKQFIVNPKILAGSMFDFFKEPQPGVAVKENGKFKFCSQEENDFEGDEKRMSYKSYQNKIGTQGNFMSSKANPELYNLIKQTQDISYLKPNPSNQGNANASQDTLKNEFISNLKNFHDQQDYYDEARQEYQLSRLGQIDSGNLNEKDRVLLQSPQSLRQLITFKNKNAQSRNGFLTQNNSTSDLKSNATNDCKFSEQITNFQQTQTFKSLKNDQNKLKQTIQNSLRERVRNAQISLAASQSQTFDNIHQTSKISMNHVQQHPPVRPFSRQNFIVTAHDLQLKGDANIKHTNRRNILIPIIKNNYLKTENNSPQQRKQIPKQSNLESVPSSTKNIQLLENTTKSRNQNVRIGQVNTENYDFTSKIASKSKPITVFNSENLTQSHSQQKQVAQTSTKNLQNQTQVQNLQSPLKSQKGFQTGKRHSEAIGGSTDQQLKQSLQQSDPKSKIAEQKRHTINGKTLNEYGLKVMPQDKKITKNL